MKLLNEKEIEEAAKVAAGFDKNKKIDYDERYYNTSGCAKYDSFKSGALFTEQKLMPLMVEFKQFCDRYEKDRPFYEHKTDKQLLEQFIKSKQDESTEMS